MRSAPVRLFCDNRSTIQMLENPTHHERTKHIDIDCHFARDHVRSGLILPVYIEYEFQLVDLFMKALGPA